jgi:ERCC4-related helicase
LINIEIRCEEDPDVSDHVHDIELEIVRIELPKRVGAIAEILRSMYAYCIQ